MSIYYLDGEFVEAEKAMLSVNDLTVLRGYGIFDFMRTYNKRPFHLEEHIERLIHSGEKIGLELPCSREELYSIVMETLKRNEPGKDGEYNIRIVYTGGVCSDSVTPGGNGKLIVMVTPKQPVPAQWYRDGVKIITVDVERYMPEAKSTNYLNAIVAQQKAAKAGAVESIYVDHLGRVLEGTTTNIFLYLKGRWVTPDEGILKGITRACLLDLIGKHADLELRDLSRKDIATAEEIMITASNKEIVPVVQVDDMLVGDGKVGVQTRRIMEAFHKLTRSYGREKLRAL